MINKQGESDRFLTVDTEYLESFCVIASVAIESRYMVDSLNAAQAGLETLLKQNRLLLEMTKCINEEREIPGLSCRVSSFAREILGATFCQFFLLDANPDVMVCYEKVGEGFQQKKVPK